MASLNKREDDMELAHEERQLPVMGAVGHEVLDPHISDDRGDPRRAALEDINPNAKVTLSTWAAAFFIGSTYTPSITCTILLVFPILVPIGLDLDGSTKNVNWMASGWSLVHPLRSRFSSSIEI